MQDQDRQRSDDQMHESQPGLAAVADDVRGLLASLTEEIAATRRRYDDALAQIEARIGEIEKSAASRRAAASAAGRDPSEPWDTESAEALTRAYEGEHTGGDTPHANAAFSAEDRQRLDELPERIMAALAEMRPQNSLAALEDRFGSFEAHITAAVADVARRSDVDGLNLIEAHLSDLVGRLDNVETQLDKLASMENALRTVSEQLSDERLSGFLSADHHFAADLETVARTAAEEMQARFAETVAANGGNELKRQEEIKALIESAIREQRRGDDELNAVFSDLGGVVHRQVDRYEELHGLIDSAMSDRRKGEEQMIGMLDTLQQALVQVLDRIDTLEAATPVHAAPAPSSMQAMAAASPQPASSAPMPPEVIAMPPPASAPAAAPTPDHEMGLGVAHVLSDPETVESWKRPSAPRGGVADAPAPVAAAPMAPEATDESEDEVQPEPQPEQPLSPIERMRRELLADAQRARLKAATRTSGGDEAAPRATTTTEAAPRAAGRPAPTSTAALRATPVQAAPVPKGAPRKILGLSPKLLAGALALVIAINGGLLLLSRGNETPPQDRPPAASSPATPDAAPQAPEKRSDLGGDSLTTTELAAADSLAFETEYPDSVAAVGAPPPRGVTVVEPVQPPRAEDQAMLYEQQMMADMSSELGAKAANASLTEMLPEMARKIPNVAGSSGARVGMLDLPPLTVGPLSLRLAAANGDPSAQFEVGARLAEGRGINQDFKEAMRWYQRSAAQGFAQSQYRLGTLYERGLGTEADVGRARVWYERAAEQGNIKAMHNLAVLAAGPEQGAPDYVEAARWFGEAAQSGLADSQYNLGVLYENGLGVTQNPEMAYKWYSLAAASGDPEAVKRRDQLKTLLSPEELQTAAQLVSAFQAKPRETLANDPRAAGQEWQRRQSGNGDNT